MKREEFIFTGIADAVLYFFIYILIPAIQIITGAMIGSNPMYAMHLFALVSMLGLFYDCTTRFDAFFMEETARRKMFWIGLISIILIAVSVSAIIIHACNGVFPDILNITYSIIVVPFFICVHDGWYVAKEQLGLR